MQKRTLREFIKTILIALAVCVFAYTGTASFGYMAFGSHVNEDILLSYKPTADVLVAVILIAAKMYTTYPILLFVGRYVHLDGSVMYVFVLVIIIWQYVPFFSHLLYKLHLLGSCDWFS